MGTTNPCPPGEEERRSLGLGTEVPVLQVKDSEKSGQGKTPHYERRMDRVKHHSMKGEKVFKIITSSKEADRECFIWQGALLYMHLKGRIPRRKKRKPHAGMENTRWALPQGCTHGVVEKPSPGRVPAQPFQSWMADSSTGRKKPTMRWMPINLTAFWGVPILWGTMAVKYSVTSYTDPSHLLLKFKRRKPQWIHCGRLCKWILKSTLQDTGY